MENRYNQPIMPVCIEEDEIDLKELFATIWRYKFFILIFTAVVGAITFIYVMAKPNEYKVFTKLAPMEHSKGINLGGLGALAGLAGISLPSQGNSGDLAPDVAYGLLIDDYEFMKQFIKKRGFDKLMYDEKLQKDYVFAFNNRYFYELIYSHKQNKKTDFYSDVYLPFKKRFEISTDKKTGLIEISYIHPSRKFAYKVLNAFLEDGTKYLVAKNLKDINSQITKYQKELANTNNLELKAELAKIISSLIKQKVFINTGKYYKVKVIIDPYIPDIKAKVKPKRGLILIVALITSLILSIFIVFLIEFIKSDKKDAND